MAFRRAYKPRGRSSVASKSRARAVYSKRRSDRVSRARRATITRIAKKAVIKAAERKYTPFVPILTTYTDVPANMLGQCYVNVINQDTAIYPAMGDNEHSRDGQNYLLQYLATQCWVEIQGDHAHQPLEVLLVRLKQHSSVTTGIATVEQFFPESETTSAGLVVLKHTGRFNSQYGTVIGRRFVYPNKEQVANTNKIYAATGDGSIRTVNKIVEFNWKINRKFTDNSTSAVYPIGLNDYALIFFDHTYNYGNAVYRIMNIHTRCVFRDT